MENPYASAIQALLSPEGKASMLRASKKARTSRYQLVEGGINVLRGEKTEAGLSARKQKAVNGSLLGEYEAVLVSAQERFDTRSEDGQTEITVCWELVSWAGNALDEKIRTTERIFLDENGDSFILDALEESIVAKYPEAATFGLEAKLKYLLQHSISIYVHPNTAESGRIYNKFYHNADSFSWGYGNILEARAELDARKKPEVPIPDFDDLGSEEYEKDFEGFEHLEDEDEDI